MVPVTTYYLDPQDFGIMAIITAITMPIGPLASSGAMWVLAGNYYKIEERERKVLVFNIVLLDFVLKFFWVVVFFLLSPLFLPILIRDFMPQYLLYFRLILVSSLLATFWPSISYLIVLQEKGRVHAFFEILQWLTGALTTILCLAVFKMSTITLFIAPLFSGVASFIMVLWYARRNMIAEFSKRWLTELLHTGSQSIVWNLSETVVNVSDRYFIQRWINLSQLGIYSHSLSYRTMFTMGTKAFSKAFSPAFLETFSNRSDSRGLKRDIRFFYGFLGIVGFFLSLFSYEIVDVLTHGKFIAAAPLLPVWFLMVLSFTYGFPYTQFLFVLKKNAFMVYSGILVNLFFIGATVLSIYLFDIIGAAVSIVLSNFVIHLSRRVYSRRLGCDLIGEKDFWIMTTLILGTVLVSTFIHPDIFTRVLGFFLVTGVVVYWYNLTSPIKANFKRAVTCMM